MNTLLDDDEDPAGVCQLCGLVLTDDAPHPCDGLSCAPVRPADMEWARAEQLRRERLEAEFQRQRRRWVDEGWLDG